MDVSDILAVHKSKQQSIVVEKEVPLEVDAGLLLVSDFNEVEEATYQENLEEYLQMTARDGVQALLTSLFTLPTNPTTDGPLAQLPPPVFQLPRAKPLPKPKPPTKWEQFARAKGINKKRVDRKIWDEEKQDWVARWGRNGKNKETETQWATEVPANAPVDFDPAKAARDARKSRVTKNERQRLQNVARAQGPTSSSTLQERRGDIDRTLATTRVSTASMGRFDRRLEGEKAMKGVKRKFDPTESSASDERKASLSLINKMASDASKIRRPSSDGPKDNTLNVRKAIRSASRGRGSASLARGSSSTRSKRKGQ